MFYSRAFREEKSAQWLLIHFVAVKTAILCSNNKIPQWSSELALHCSGPDKAHRFLSVKCSCYCYPRALLCISPCVCFQKRSCKPSSLVVPRWSQKWYRGTSWFWFQSSCRKAGPFSMSALRWGRKLSCLIEKISGHYMELLKIRKTRLSKDFHQWATFAFPLILRQVAFLKSENSVTHMYSNE